MQNSPKVYYIKLEFGENFLTKKVHFQKNGFFKKVIFLIQFFQPISYNDLFATKKILLFSIFCRSRRRTPTVILEGVQVQGRKRGSFSLSSKYLDGVFALHDLLGLGKTQLKSISTENLVFLVLFDEHTKRQQKSL